MDYDSDLSESEIRNSTAYAPAQDVLIIGGGYAGVVTAVHVMRNAESPLRLAIIEPRMRLGRGVAYDTPLDCHVLNTRAKRMSLRPNDERHYTSWAQARATMRGLTGIDEDSFTPRGWFGDYVGEELNAAVAANSANFIHVRRSALSCERAHNSSKVERGVWNVGLSDGRSISAPVVVLATGNSPQRAHGFPGLRSSDHRVLHAWDLIARNLRTNADTLIVGTGLTMVDAVLTLQHRGHRGKIHVISRHGLLPLPHTTDHGRVEPLDSVRLRDLMRELRTAVKNDELYGRPWQWRMDAARHQAQKLWRGLMVAERRRFLRHARSYWNIHRHRVAPDIAQRIRELTESQRLVIHRGRVGEISATAGGLEVEMRSSGGAKLLRVSHLINSLGFELDARRSDAPLLQNLLRTGVARPGFAGLGLRTDELGRLQSASGRTWSSLYTLGSLRAGELWETTSAHEIQEQALVLAKRLAQQTAQYPVPF
jgi:uncharacterized NAD(P)/FAD-binding protein YdhS